MTASVCNSRRMPRVAVAKVPESHVVDDILVLAEDFEEACILVVLQCSLITSLWSGLTP